MLEPREQAALLAEQAALPSVRIWLNNSGGYIALNWANDGAIGKYDYVALYDKKPTDPKGYLANQWQYTSEQSSPFVTWTSAEGVKGPKYWIAYCGWDYKSAKYEIVSSAGPSQP